MLDPLVLYAVGTSVGVFFGMHDVVIRGSRSNMDSRHMLLASLLSGYPVVFLFSLVFWGFSAISIESIILYIIAGLVNFNVGRASLYVAIRSIGASGASIMLTLSIVIGIALGLGVGERISPTQALGAVLILIAAIMVAWRGEIKRDPRGIAAGLVASFGLALAIFLSRLGNINGGDPFAGALIAYTSSIAFEAFLLRNTEIRSVFSKNNAAVYLAGVLASLGQVARYVALVQLGASIVTPLQNIRPVVATTLTRVFYSRTAENPGLRGYTAALIAFTGVLLMAI
ncbi:MAG TPA: DMT family transporter [Sulfolobales archaeon]|nr:DMT family transporter [Sulfolobales archaeon]